MTDQEKLDALREFARRVFRQSWEGIDVDGGDIQEWGSELGLLKSRPATRDDVENSNGDFDVGDEIFLLEDWMRIPSPPDGLPYR